MELYIKHRPDLILMDIRMEKVNGIHATKKIREIVHKLFLSEATVRNYMSNILDKLSLRDRTQLAIYYYRKKYAVQ